MPLESGEGKSERVAVDQEKNSEERRGEVRQAASLDRKEVLLNMDVNWDDEYVLEFAKDYPEVMRQHMEEMRKVAEMDKSSEEYVSAKAQLFDHIVGNLQWRIRAEHMNQQSFEYSLKTFRGNPSERKEISAKLLESRRKTVDFEKFKGNLILMKKAYERFSADIKVVGKRLLKEISTGEIQISEKIPYVMFVNKDSEKQYSVIYRYDFKTKKLSFKTCNIVSTGDNVRWMGEEPRKKHTTPDRVFYIGETRGLKHSSLTDDSEVYGGGFVEKDGEPYQAFRLYFKKDGEDMRTGYLIHPTWEEPLLGETASHGCIRVPRLMNLQLVRIYDEFYKGSGVDDFKKFPPDKLRHPSVRMPVVVRGI